MSANPFRVLERIARVVKAVVLWAFIIALAALGIAAIGMVAARDLGWWALALIPGVPLAFCVLIVLVALGHMAAGFIRDRWRNARQRWDFAHREQS